MTMHNAFKGKTGGTYHYLIYSASNYYIRVNKYVLLIPCKTDWLLKKSCVILMNWYTAIWNIKGFLLIKLSKK